jgi:hypothetical protein
MATADISATTTITFEQLTKYFHLPINDVAKELGICATMLKKICRKNGIPRWPHRKIKSLNKMIENLEASLQNNASEAEECILQEINILKNKKSLIMKNPSILVQGGSHKRPMTDPEGKSVKKLRASEGEDVPVATLTLPKSSIAAPSSSPIAINQLLTPSYPFSTPLTSYLLNNEEKDDKDSSPRRVDESQLVVRPPSPTGQSYYKSQRQQQFFLPPNMADFHNTHRNSVEFLTSAQHPSYAQQAQGSMQPQQSLQGQESLPPYVLPKLNFSTTTAQQPSGSYMTSPSAPKFRPPSPITSSHQQAPPYAAPQATEAYAPRHTPAHFFHHYHPQMPTVAPTTQAFKPQYTGPQTPTPHQQMAHTTPTSLPQQPTTPVVLRWVMEYEKPGKK